MKHVTIKYLRNLYNNYDNNDHIKTKSSGMTSVLFTTETKHTNEINTEKNNLKFLSDIIFCMWKDTAHTFLRYGQARISSNDLELLSQVTR